VAVDPRSPCLIGVAQRTVHPADGPAPEPLDLWAEVAQTAIADAGGDGRGLRNALASLRVLYCQSWPYDDPAGRLSARLGLEPAERVYSGIGGTTPHVLLTDAAGAIAAGDLDAALVVGGEALQTVRKAKRAGERLAWSFRDPEKRPFPFEAPFHPAEVAHEVFQAWLTFALFDVARRAHLGVPPDAYRSQLGDLLAPMTSVAASNPHAWFRERRTSAELTTPSPDNRMVGYPYTKSMVAVMDVDMAAALVVTSHAKADELGVPLDRRVYLRGWASASDPVYVAEHDPLWSSPAMAASASGALAGAGVGVGDIARFDLYSCFASSLVFACDALGIHPTDERGLTVTGGLPFAGGPGSGYMLHSIASMTDVLREDAGAYGLVSGVGMHMTKHAFGVYSTTPPPSLPLAGPKPPEPPPPAPRPIVSTWEGPARVATYSVIHDRGGDATSGLAVCDVSHGGRTYARIEDRSRLEAMEQEEWTGRPVDLVTAGGGVNRIV